MEPTLQLLGVQFDQNVARNIMTEQRGAATKLVYQLYVALEKKKKAGLTGVAMEAMRPSAPAKLKSVGTEMYREVSCYMWAPFFAGSPFRWHVEYEHWKGM